MFKKLFNLTNQVVVTEVENVLTTYPDHPYQQAFAIPLLRQELVAFVLSQVRNLYTVVEEGEELQTDPELLDLSAKQQPDIDALIPQGITQILQKNGEWVSHHIPEPVDAGNSASHWFG